MEDNKKLLLIKDCRSCEETTPQKEDAVDVFFARVGGWIFDKIIKILGITIDIIIGTITSILEPIMPILCDVAPAIFCLLVFYAIANLPVQALLAIIVVILLLK